MKSHTLSCWSMMMMIWIVFTHLLCWRTATPLLLEVHGLSLDNHVVRSTKKVARCTKQSLHGKNNNNDDHDVSDSCTQPSCLHARRNFLAAAAAGTTTAAAGVALFPQQTDAAVGSLFQKDRRQMELCVVSVIRVLYWAEQLGKDLTDLDDSDNKKKNKYLEARLASKALVVGKLGGGATYRIFQLNSLQFRDCLDDLVYYFGLSSIDKKEKQRAKELEGELLEALASIVEFDGLETTLDPSPRSSLTLSMFTEQKALFVRRTLLERVVPVGNRFLRLVVSTNVQTKCEDYVENFYPNELPERLKVVVSEPAIE